MGSKDSRPKAQALPEIQLLDFLYGEWGALVSGKNCSGMPTSDKFSGRVELSHFILGGLPDVNYSLPYFRPVGCDSGRCASADGIASGMRVAVT